MKRVIEQTEDGSATLFVPELNEHYHSVKGAQTESRHIFIDMGLNASRAAQPHVLEIGFGTGLNALLTLEEAERRQREVRYTGIERYPLSWEEVKALEYSENPLFRQLHTVPWEKEVKISPHFTLKKICADVTELFEGDKQPGKGNDKENALSEHNESLPLFDVVYFDAFAPEKQPEMWGKEVLTSIYGCMNEGGVLTTYCAKGDIRRLLQAIGFRVERLPGPPNGKREILRATK